MSNNIYSDEKFFTIGTVIAEWSSFIIVWIIALCSWGFLLGLTFGWIPALIAAKVFKIIWPFALSITLLVIGIGLIYLLISLKQ